jgi:periplasmic copper chaperone A
VLVAGDLDYALTTAYISSMGGTHQLQIAPAGTSAVSLSQYLPYSFELPMETHGFYTLIATASENPFNVEAMVLPMDGVILPPPVLGEATEAHITISGGYARATVMAAADSSGHGHGGHQMGGMGSVSAAYMTLVNASDEADSLIAISTDVAEVAEVHQTMVVDGMASMEAIPELVIPAGGSVELMPGSYHIMLMNLTRELAPEEMISLTLTFASGLEVMIELPVRDMMM